MPGKRAVADFGIGGPGEMVLAGTRKGVERLARIVGVPAGEIVERRGDEHGTVFRDARTAARPTSGTVAEKQECETARRVAYGRSRTAPRQSSWVLVATRIQLGSEDRVLRS